MQVARLIQCLSRLPMDSEVIAWDPDSDDYQSVTGYIDAGNTVELCTSDDS